jgi:mRNA interferase RelE/StbE
VTAIYRIHILDAAARELARLDKPVGRRIVERLNWLVANFDTVTPEPLTGELSGLYKFRVGDYRILYEILHDEQILVIHAIGHRREIYRRR